MRLIDDIESPLLGAVATCVKLGVAQVELRVGNIASSTNKKPVTQRKMIRVHCSQPSKISKIDVQHHNVNGIQIKNPIVNKKTGRIMTYSYRDFSLVATVKDTEGRTFDNTSSLVFRVKMSDDSFALIGKSSKFPFSYVSGVPSSFKLPMRGEHTRIFTFKYLCFQFRNCENSSTWCHWRC